MQFVLFVLLFAYCSSFNPAPIALETKLKISTKPGLKMLLAAVAAMTMVPFAVSPALGETVTETQHDVPFSAVHNCTLENVTGDTTMHATVTITTGTDGVKQVHILQRTLGTHMIGVTSGDSYNFNNAEDYHEHFTVGSGGGHVMTRTEYIHHGEGLANMEQQGLDDYHQRITVLIPATGPPTVVKTEAECR